MTYDLSMNETPFEPLPSVARLVVEAARQLNRYPDHVAGGLVAALADRLAVAPEKILVGPGSAGLCQHLIQALAGQGHRNEVVHAALSFEAYPLIFANAGARPVAVPMAGYHHDLAAMAAAVNERTRCVVVCSPNNPTSVALSHAELADLLERVPKDVPVIIDEAYHEFVTGAGVADGMRLAQEHSNVCVLRTFSKAYGLAALRVGYAVAPPAVVAAARMVGMMFFPSGPGQVAAAASLRPDAEAELTKRCAELAGERRRLGDSLREAGFTLAASEANFLWLDVGESAVSFTERCRAAGVLVRAYPGHGVRVTIGTPEANDHLLSVARASHSGQS